MWTSTLHLAPQRIFLTKLLGLFYSNIYYTSLSPLQVRNIPRQSLPSASWVRVRNRLAGICGSDLHLIFADADTRIAPAVLPGHQHLYPGHEVVGEVIEIGNDVQHLQVGDRVVLQSAANCLSAGIYPPCHSCAIGNYNLCERGMLPGPQPIGGGWSEEMLVHEQQLFRLPDDLSNEQGVLLEPTAVAIHAVLRHLPQPGERVLIIGAGTIGLLILQVLQALAPQAEVSVLPRYAHQREQATRMGATYLIDPTDSYGQMQEVTHAQLYQGPFGNRMLLGGYDVVYDTVGHRNTLHHALRWTRAQATIVLVGVNLHMMHIDLTPIWYQQVNLLGSTSHGMETWPPQTKQSSSTFSIAAELMIQDRLHPEQLITHHFALSHYKDALMTATHKAHSHAIKVVFDYSGERPLVVPNSIASARTPLPPATSTEMLTTTQKLTYGLPYDHTKEALRQMRLSLRYRERLSTTTKNVLPSTAESQANAIAPDEHPAPKTKIALELPELSSSQKQLQLASEMDQPTPVKKRNANKDKLASLTSAKNQLASEIDQPTPAEKREASENEPASPTSAEKQLASEMDQPTPVKNKEASEDTLPSLASAEEKNGVVEADKVFSFPDVEDTPTVRVQPGRNKRKRKTKPIA